jgi:hypothetical protein
MNKQRHTRLALRGETLRVLQTTQLSAVVGGVQTSCINPSCAPIFTAQSNNLTCQTSA